MIFHRCLIAATSLAISVCTSQAAPEDWVGKEFPKIRADFVKAKPSLQGKPVVVEFWHRLCKPCVASIPHLNELHNKYKDKGLVVIGICTDQENDLKAFRKQTQIDYHVAIDEKVELSPKLGITGIPHAFLLDKEGKVVWTGGPGGLNDALIESVLK